MIRFVEGIKRQWLMTVDAMVDPLMMVSADYTVLRANRAMADHAGVDVRMMMGEKCHRLLAGSEKPCKECKLQDSLKNQSRQRFALEMVRGKFDFDVASQPIVNSTGQLEGAVHVYRDQTESKALQRQLIQSEKLASIGVLAGGIAHEINNPLGGILIFAQMLLREVPEDSPFLPDIQEIENAAKRCKSIVAQLLEFARTQPGDRRKKYVSTDGNDAARSALRFASVHLNARKTKVVQGWSEQRLEVTGEHNLLIQVFLNLMQNAFQAMPDGGSLNVSSRAEDRDGIAWGVWSIQDSGDGIPPENLEKLFDPFFTTKEPGEGTGLGLSICYGICKELDGYIDVESVVGEGSCFRVHLPLVVPS